MQFVSIVGTQVMAVLAPLLAVSRHYKDIDRVSLLVTAKSETPARKIKEFLATESKLFTKAAVQMITISNGLAENGNDPAPCHIAIRKIGINGPILFNLAGGMKFQIAACMHELPAASAYVYPAFGSIYLFTFASKALRNCPCTFPSIPVDVLSLQSVQYSQEQPDPGRESVLVELFHKCKVSEPKEVRRNIRIGGILFDMVWDTYNAMNFMVYFAETGDSCELARILIGTAEDRRLWGELYSRRIIVISPDQLLVKRLRNESKGKVTALRVATKDARSRSVMRSELESLFTPAATDYQPESRNKQTLLPGKLPFLLVPLGRDPLTTLIALWSHRPKTACIVYDASSPDICLLVESLQEQKGIIPIPAIHFVPVSFFADGVLDIELQATSGRIEVNITPGSKIQAAMLTLWAKQHDATVYSLDTGREISAPLIPSTAKHYMLSAPAPRELIKLLGHKAKKKTTIDLRQSKSLLETAQQRLEFLGECIRRGIGIKSLFKGKVSDSSLKLTCTSNALAVDSGKTVITFPRDDNGAWFEQLAGAPLLACGADDVHLNLATQWSKDAQALLSPEARKKGIHMSEIDVVARFGGKYVAVSAKSGKISLNPAVEEIKGAATMLGRFTTPVLARLFYQDGPYELNGVWVIGPTTLCDSASMKAFLTQAMRSRRTTEE